MPTKKLIEAGMPVDIINTEAEREKTARTSLPSSVHVWWTRRSMAAARSTLFASMVDDPAEHPELFPTEESRMQERERFLRLTAALASLDHVEDTELLNTARQEIERYAAGVLPDVFDPFSGSGAIAVEAHRLGLNTRSSDLNAVAALTTAVVSDIPTRFAVTAPVHSQENMTMQLPLPGAQGFAEDLLRYGNDVLIRTKQEIGFLYPQAAVPGEETSTDVIAWIWARTVKCPSPSCRCNIPLSSSYDLARKAGAEAWVEPVVSDGQVSFVIHHSPRNGKKQIPKVGQTAVFKCPACGEITTDAYVKECGLQHQIQSQMIAVVTEDGKKRRFLEPDEIQRSAADVPVPKEIPHGKLPNYPRRFSPPSFGLTDYVDLFTNRQLTFLTTMLRNTAEIAAEVERDAIESGFANDGIPFADGGTGALAYAQAIRITLTLTVSKLLDRCSNICSWDSSGPGSLRNVFSRAAMPMIWDYAEANPFGRASGSFLNTLERTCDAIAHLPVDASSVTAVADATQPNSVRGSMLSTDLPYFARASYGDLSDFFYVWLKFGLQDILPGWFQEDVSPKKPELTAFSYRWNGDKQQANAFYAEGLLLAFQYLHDSVTDQYPSTACFAYLNAELTDPASISEWETFITAVYNAGFTITATWPLDMKPGDAAGREGKELPVTVVLRKRPEDALQTTRRNFVAAVKRELPDILRRLRPLATGRVLRTMVIGPALEIFTRYKKVLDADGSVIRPHLASRIIEQELDTLLASDSDV